VGHLRCSLSMGSMTEENEVVAVILGSFACRTPSARSSAVQTEIRSPSSSSYLNRQVLKPPVALGGSHCRSLLRMARSLARLSSLSVPNSNTNLRTSLSPACLTTLSAICCILSGLGSCGFCGSLGVLPIGCPVLPRFFSSSASLASRFFISAASCSCI